MYSRKQFMLQHKLRAPPGHPSRSIYLGEKQGYQSKPETQRTSGNFKRVAASQGKIPKTDEFEREGGEEMVIAAM